MDVTQLLKTIDQTSRRIIERGVQHAPILLVGRKGEVQPVKVQDFDDIKQYFPAWGPVLLGQLEADWYVIIFESWITSPSEERARKLQAGELRISDLPPDDRFEALMVVGGNRSGTEKVYAWAKIHDTPAGRKMDELHRLEGGWQSRFYIDHW